jgi:hypothetical protein
MTRSGTDVIEIKVSDVSKQKVLDVDDVPTDATVGDLVQGLLREMGIPSNDHEGRSLTYRAMLHREGRHLFSHERVGDVLETGDHLTLQRNVDAG